MDDPNATTGHFVMRSVPEAAAECGVPEATLRRWIADGVVTAITIGGNAMVNEAEVAIVRDRFAGKRGASGRRWFRALGAVNVVAALVGLLVFFGIGPAGLRAPWWLGLCLASLAVGALLWRGGVSARGRHRGRRS